MSARQIVHNNKSITRKKWKKWKHFWKLLKQNFETSAFAHICLRAWFSNKYPFPRIIDSFFFSFIFLKHAIFFFVLFCYNFSPDFLMYKCQTGRRILENNFSIQAAVVRITLSICWRLIRLLQLFLSQLPLFFSFFRCFHFWPFVNQWKARFC